MGWPLKTTVKELLEVFSGYIAKNQDVLKEHNILIWGASVRGTLLGLLLERNGYTQFWYVDNDERKWGENINGYTIDAPETVKKINNTFILIPIEYGTEIKVQLEEWGLEEGKDFEVINAGINEKYVEEFFREYDGERLILGESFLNQIALDKKNAKSIKDRIWQEFGKKGTKILSMDCMGMQMFYHVLKIQVNMGLHPKELWLFTSYETLTEFHHLLSRTQHADLLKLIQKRGKIEESEYLEYIRMAEKRAANYEIEMQFSPKRTGGKNKISLEEIQREYLKISLCYQLNLHSEEAGGLERMLLLARKYNIAVRVIMVPVNYELAQTYYGNQFDKLYASNNLKLKKYVEDLQGHFYDMSFLLKKEEFVSAVTISDGLYERGQQKVIEFLRRMV